MTFTSKITAALRSRATTGQRYTLRFQSTLSDSSLSDEPQRQKTSSGVKNNRRIIKATNAPVVNEFKPFSSVASSHSGVKFDNTSSSNSSASVGDDKVSNNPFDVNGDLIENVQEDGTEISLEELYNLATQPCTPLSLSDMYKYASKNVNSKNYAPQRLRNAQFLHKELPIRVAQRAVDLLTLPHGLNKTPQVQKIAHAYLRYLKNLIEFPCPQNDEEEREFTDALREIVKDRKTIPMAIAKGVASLKDNRKEELDVYRLQEMEKALYRFFNARTGLRLLAEHHILSCLKRQQDNVEFRKKQSCMDDSEKTNSFIGCIKDDCDPHTEIQQVAEQVMEHCKDCYGMTPKIEILECTPEKYASSNFTFVPHHLQYTIAELLKNSCRATIGKHLEGNLADKDGIAAAETLPPVRVVIAKGAEDVTIKIADKGGGVPRSVLDQMWTFAHSGASDEIQSKENDTSFETDEFSGGNIRGFGLPMARIYARYFGGELTLKSMEGYGVDAYLYLPVLGDACENLPKRVRKSPANHDSVHDGNHHTYDGDVFSSSFLSGEEPWAGGARHFSSTRSVSFETFDRIAI
jgi:pyruvate dehydrogenase kinase 2/3/4